MTTATYETDFYLWTQQQADLLRQGQFNRVDLDLVNIAEEIESMGRSGQRAVEGYLRNILLHLLKWQYQPERRGNSWRLSIRDGRHQVAKRLRESPSLKPQVSTMIADEYPLAREYAANETGLPLATFPEQCPFTAEQVTGDYWPD
ncbi:MAG: hypothetical protein QG599_3480 [Pseudomonadota bacterium]|nr:hypothetical protein [Pseudomonadota bacterium]